MTHPPSGTHDPAKSRGMTATPLDRGRGNALSGLNSIQETVRVRVLRTRSVRPVGKRLPSSVRAREMNVKKINKNKIPARVPLKSGSSFAFRSMLANVTRTYVLRTIAAGARDLMARIIERVGPGSPPIVRAPVLRSVRIIVRLINYACTRERD